MTQAITATAEQRKTMNALLDNLFRMRDELMLLDMRGAQPDKFAEYNQSLYDIGIAISSINGSILRSISSDFAQQLPNFESATKKVAADLYSLRKTSAVLNAVSKAMSTVTSIITLLK
jgi:hypothetical protein